MPAQSFELGAASAGIDFQVGVVAVRLAGQKRFQLGATGAGFERFQHLARLVDQAVIAFQIAQFGEFQRVFQLLLDAQHSVHGRGQFGAFARNLLSLFGLVPQRRVFDPRVQFVETA